jgi:hypothetical protein
MRKLVSAGAALLLLAGCATRIYPKDETITPSKVKLSTFTAVVAKPMGVERVAGEGDPEGVNTIHIALINCLKPLFPNLKQVGSEQTEFAPGTVIIEPAIEDMKRVTPAQRVFASQIAGSSAVLLRTRYTDAASGQVIASPVFYAKADARAGAWTMGVMDHVMLGRVADLACSYAKSNY